jgi:hypothetical protein
LGVGRRSTTRSPTSIGSANFGFRGLGMPEHILSERLNQVSAMTKHEPPTHF